MYATEYCYILLKIIIKKQEIRLIVKHKLHQQYKKVQSNNVRKLYGQDYLQKA